MIKKKVAGQNAFVKVISERSNNHLVSDMILFHKLTKKIIKKENHTDWFKYNATSQNVRFTVHSYFSFLLTPGYQSSHSLIQFSQYQIWIMTKGISSSFSMDITLCQGNLCPIAGKLQHDWIHVKEPGLQIFSGLAPEVEPGNGAS